MVRRLGVVIPLLPTTECRSLFYSFVVLKTWYYLPTEMNLIYYCYFHTFVTDAALICSRTSVNDDATETVAAASQWVKSLILRHLNLKCSKYEKENL